MSSSMWYMVRSTKDLLENEEDYDTFFDEGIRDTRSGCRINDDMEEIDVCMCIGRTKVIGERWKTPRWYIYKRWCRVFKVVQL